MITVDQCARIAVECMPLHPDQALAAAKLWNDNKFDFSFETYLKMLKSGFTPAQVGVLHSKFKSFVENSNRGGRNANQATASN